MAVRAREPILMPRRRKLRTIPPDRLYGQATRRKAYRTAPLKDGRAYRQLWRIVDGAVRSALETHPDYLTEKGRRTATARRLIVKRVVGAVMGYAEQSAQGRSGASPAAERQAPGTLAEPVGDGLLQPSQGDRATSSRSPISPSAWGRLRSIFHNRFHRAEQTDASDSA